MRLWVQFPCGLRVCWGWIPHPVGSLSPPPLPRPLRRLAIFHRYSERSTTKCVGITIETRPDYCLKRHLSDMLAYGCTRLEIGVQSVYEDVARDTNRLVGRVPRLGEERPLSAALECGVSVQGPHGAGRLRVLPPGQGCRL